MKYVWLVIHYMWEDSDVVAITESRNKAYALRKQYKKKLSCPESLQSVHVTKYELNKLNSIYSD